MVSKQNVNYAAWTHLAAATHCVETLLTIIPAPVYSVQVAA